MGKIGHSYVKYFHVANIVPIIFHSYVKYFAGWGKPRDTGNYSKIADMTGLSVDARIPRLNRAFSGIEGILFVLEETGCYAMLCSLCR